MFKTLMFFPEKLSRVTSGGKIIKQIDGLRFMAILPVVIQHLAERFDRNTNINFSSATEHTLTSFLAARGFIGVYIFFVISGFVLVLPFAKYKLYNTKKISLPQYFLRRITRLEPTYIIWISLFFVVFVIHNHLNLIESLPHYFSSITYTHGLFYQAWSPINPPTWTLEIEIQFYILAPFLAMGFFSIKNKNTRRVINSSIILIIIVIQQQFKFYTNPFNLTILGHLHYFLIGFLLADFYLCDFSLLKGSILYDLAAVLMITLLVYTWSWNFEITKRILFVIFLFLFFYSVFKSHYFNLFVSNRWITAIGGMCYTIYLIHLPLAEFFIGFTNNLYVTNYYTINLAVQLLLFIPLVLVLSAFFFLLFEKPFMHKDWPRKFAEKFKKSQDIKYSFSLFKAKPKNEQ